MSDNALAVDGLSLVFPSEDGPPLPALTDVSFTLAPGERLGVVGESGAGKSLLASAVINLVAPPGKITAGTVRFAGRNLLALPQKEMRKARGRKIASVFQDPMTTLNPVLTIGDQLTEILAAHRIAQGADAENIALQKLREVAIPSPDKRMRAYPHELSGGMRQRVIIAAALIAEPDLIVADEPTTALDVTTQAEIMHLLVSLCAARRMALILITHDLGLLAQTTDSIMVMYAGRVVERGPTAEITRAPRHPYTRGLLAALGGRNAEGRFAQIPGNMPPLSAIPAGCAYHPRCPHARDKCRSDIPAMSAQTGPAVSCHFADSLPPVKLPAQTPEKTAQ